MTHSATVVLSSESGVKNKGVSMRQLATIRRIETISDIENADRIQLATLENLGWECVIKKDEFKVGDYVVYFEVDSILPEREEFEFLRDVKFRIKTRKFRKQVSQGFISSISVLPKNTTIKEGMDVTDILGVKKHDPELVAEKALISAKKSKSKIINYMMKFKWFRKLYFALNQKSKGNWPEWCVKTDEDRIQVCAKKLMSHYDKAWYVTEKIDGSSLTAFSHPLKKWGFKRFEFGVCSRNIHLKTPDNSNFWKAVKKYDLEKKLTALKKDIYIQGECINTSIQGNKYKVDDVELHVFNVVENGVRYSVKEMVKFCNDLGLVHVPIINDNFVPSKEFGELETNEIVKKLVEMSKGLSKLYKTKREGLVYRLVEDPQISFKVISPEFLLKWDA